MPLRSGTPHHRGQLHSGTPAPTGLSSEGEKIGKGGGGGERKREGRRGRGEKEGDRREEGKSIDQEVAGCGRGKHLG